MRQPIDQAVEEVNNYIRQLGQERVIVFDAAKILSQTNGQIRQEYSFDTLHLNEKGYKVLNQELIAILKSLE